MANGLTACEAATRVKVEKTVLYKALAVEDAGLGLFAES